MIIKFVTLGCKVNQYEADALAELLQQKGEIITEENYADIYIISSCAVTNEAEKKSRQMVAKCLSYNPKAKIVVCGCASQNNAKQFANENITFVTGNANKKDIIENLLEKKVQINNLPCEYESDLVSTKSTLIREYVKIQDGCNNFCSYCLIPYVRGRSRSRALEDIVKEVKTKSLQAKEIVLTGIDISDYKIDGKLALVDLLEKLDKFNVRIRLGSLEVRIITEEFVKRISQLKNLCPHFHLSLQSGSTSVLKKMNRHYTAEEYINSTLLLKKYFKYPAITTDIIVGFPEETDDEFDGTISLCQKVEFAKIHIFPYSKRNGTRAEKLIQVPSIIKKQRCKELFKINDKYAKKYINSAIDMTFSLIIEEQNNGYYIGHTENYIKCYLMGEYKINDMVKVKIIRPYLDGAIVEGV